MLTLFYQTILKFVLRAKKSASRDLQGCSVLFCLLVCRIIWVGCGSLRFSFSRGSDMCPQQRIQLDRLDIYLFVAEDIFVIFVGVGDEVGTHLCDAEEVLNVVSALMREHFAVEPRAERCCPTFAATSQF